jgi:hypothetical protein
VLPWVAAPPRALALSQVATPQTCSASNYSTTNCSNAMSCTTVNCSVMSLQCYELITLGVCNATAPHCHWPSLQSSWAFYDAMTSDVTLQIFIRSWTFVCLGTFVKLSSVQGRSLDFIHWVVVLHHNVLTSCVFYRPVVLRSAILPSCHLHLTFCYLAISFNVRSSPFIPINVSYSSNPTLC